MILTWLFDTEICRLCGHVGARENKDANDNFTCAWCGNSQRHVQAGQPKMKRIVNRIVVAFGGFRMK